MKIAGLEKYFSLPLKKKMRSSSKYEIEFQCNFYLLVNYRNAVKSVECVNVLIEFQLVDLICGVDKLNLIELKLKGLETLIAIFVCFEIIC